MSLERAKINCERCHEVAYKQEGGKKVVSLPGFEGNRADQVYAIRNEAMRALEETKYSALMPLTLITLNEISGKESVSRQVIKKPLEDVSIVADRCLKICASCDYSAPNILNIISEYLVL